MAVASKVLHCLLSEELGPVQSVVDALLEEEFTVSANLCHLASLDHGNLVSILDGGQAVGNHNAGAALMGSTKSCFSPSVTGEEREVEEAGECVVELKCQCCYLHQTSHPHPL